MFKVKLKKPISTEHGEKVLILEIDEEITCGDIIEAGATENINELMIRLAAIKSGVSYLDILNIDAGATFKILNHFKELLGKELEESTEEMSLDSVVTADVT